MPPLDTGLDASSAQGAALAQVAPWSHARDFFCPTAFDVSSAHGAALAQVAPWPRARAFFCPSAFAHCRPFKPYCFTEAASPVEARRVSGFRGVVAFPKDKLVRVSPNPANLPDG